MGLHNREYMRSPFPDPGQDGRPMLTTLIIVNIINYFIFKTPDGSSQLALNLTNGFSAASIFQLISAGFAHVDFWHLFFNMWGLYIFGQLVVPFVTKGRFLLIYLVGVITGNLLYLLTHLKGGSVLLGASGAICAIMISAAMLEPNRRFTLLFLPFSPIKTTTLVICYTVMEILMIVGNRTDNIAHLAHLGGFIGGYIVMKIMFHSVRLPWDPFSFIKLPDSTSAPRKDPAAGSSGSNTADGNTDAPVTQRELDALLDKLSREGINSLSPFEFERLKRARRQMRGEQ